MIHKICKDCKFNKYPLCEGTKMKDGNFMNIEKLKENFQCGQKEEAELMDFSIKKKTPEQLKIEELEARILELESKVSK